MAVLWHLGVASCGILAGTQREASRDLSNPPAANALAAQPKGLTYHHETLQAMVVETAKLRFQFCTLGFSTGIHDDRTVTSHWHMEKKGEH
ncbi:hypothetical protein AXG93_3559s1160 [Marchantia polymorpha subsp. ruderalis]|uniref:Uncharacterized protein n=1 Tax=Marchantia polymorpha subsp. ruderalis TaxID=1480154 RepID=A0A176WL11_MARPO|nr:hypothetical protein AXG93_3559s1160 [Marchantia polymorpha subsp. ruderalis]